MSLATVRKKGQVTIPAAVRKAAHLEEGDLVEVEMTTEGILLRPRKLIDATQAWFWTPAWQAGVRVAAEELEAGRGERFETGEDLLSALE